MNGILPEMLSLPSIQKCRTGLKVHTIVIFLWKEFCFVNLYTPNIQYCKIIWKVLSFCRSWVVFRQTGYSEYYCAGLFWRSQICFAKWLLSCFLSVIFYKTYLKYLHETAEWFYLMTLIEDFKYLQVLTTDVVSVKRIYNIRDCWFWLWLLSAVLSFIKATSHHI